MRQRQISCDVTYLQNLKYDTNGLVCETDAWTQRTVSRLPRGRAGERWVGGWGLAGEGWVGGWGEQMQATLENSAVAIGLEKVGF